MGTLYDNFYSHYIVEDPMSKTIYNITNFVKCKQDYDSAINMLLENNLKLYDLVSRTSRLTTKEVVELANRLISIKAS